MKIKCVKDNISVFDKALCEKYYEMLFSKSFPDITDEKVKRIHIIVRIG